MKNIVRFSIFALVVGLVLSGSAQAAGGMGTKVGLSLVDGRYKKKRKAVKKIVINKKALLPKLPPVVGPPSMQIYGTVDEKQMIVNFWFFAPFSQPMVTNFGKATPLGKDGQPVAMFVNPRDQQIAESFVIALKADTAVFSSKAGSARTTAIGTIVLYKSSWSEADFALAPKLLLELFAPVKFNVWQNVYNAKPMATPLELSSDKPITGQ